MCARTAICRNEDKPAGFLYLFNIQNKTPGFKTKDNVISHRDPIRGAGAAMPPPLSDGVDPLTGYVVKRPFIGLRSVMIPSNHHSLLSHRPVESPKP
jgi:hypothetical protein